MAESLLVAYCENVFLSILIKHYLCAATDQFQFLREIQDKSSNCRILGVTHVNDKLYFIDSMSDTIRVYDDFEPFNRQRGINVLDMKDPRDIAASILPTYSCLYVLDA